MAKISTWQICGTMGTKDNTTAETTVDATFRVVEAIDVASGLNNIAYDNVANTLTMTTTATLSKFHVDLFVQFAGSNKIFEFAMFKDGVVTELIVNDKASENISVAPILELPAGTHVFDLRQRSTDGGTALTVNHIGLTFMRAT